MPINLYLFILLIKSLIDFYIFLDLIYNYLYLVNICIFFVYIYVGKTTEKFFSMKKISMKEILSLIEHKQMEFSQHPLYKFLRNEAIAPQKRLAFAPCFAFFVMGVGELNTCVFRDTLTNDPIQDLINQHTYEDDKHWIWFLEDLEKLGIDYSLRFSKTLRYLWSKKTNFSRWSNNS